MLKIDTGYYYNIKAILHSIDFEELRIRLFGSPIAKEQLSEREITYICGLGAKVGCERLSEHSTCSDESHKYRLFLFLKASPLACGKSKFVHIEQILDINFGTGSRNKNFKELLLTYEIKMI